jgi:hypothetical protein
VLLKLPVRRRRGCWGNAVPPASRSERGGLWQHRGGVCLGAESATGDISGSSSAELCQVEHAGFVLEQHRRCGSRSRPCKLESPRLGLAVDEVTSCCRGASGRRCLIERFMASHTGRRRCRSWPRQPEPAGEALSLRSWGRTIEARRKKSSRVEL